MNRTLGMAITLIAINGALVVLWGYNVLKMIFTDYTPSRVGVLAMAIILALEAAVNFAEARLKYWQERKAQAEREREDWLDSILGDWKMNDDGRQL